MLCTNDDVNSLGCIQYLLVFYQDLLVCILMLTLQVIYASQISRDGETGISRGTAFVTMRSLAEARTAINALDGLVSRLHHIFR